MKRNSPQNIPLPNLFRRRFVEGMAAGGALLEAFIFKPCVGSSRNHNQEWCGTSVERDGVRSGYCVNPCKLHGFPAYGHYG